MVMPNTSIRPGLMDPVWGAPGLLTLISATSNSVGTGGRVLVTPGALSVGVWLTCSTTTTGNGCWRGAGLQAGWFFDGPQGPTGGGGGGGAAGAGARAA